MEKIVVHPVLGEILYVKNRRSKSIKVSVKSGGVIHVSLPYSCKFSDAEVFVGDNVDRILNLISRVESRKRDRVMVNNLSDQQRAELMNRAKSILPVMLKELAEDLNNSVKVRNFLGFSISKPFSYNRVYIKNNVSNWGSCSVRKNINLNVNLLNLPEHLMRYVMLHELCHLVYMNHSAKFHKLLNDLCGGREDEFRRELRGFTLR